MKVVIHKFKTIENLTVNIPAEISGGNGTGKTTILEAISFCLTGKDLSGSEFKQIYDNRQDLHDAKADVSFFDDYGNEYRRTVEPIFQTSRAGVEEIKILRSTRCTKNGIDVKDYAPDFADFYKFGSDYFFNQKEADQRNIFIDLMKSKLPDYDVAESQLKLKSLKRTQKMTMGEIDVLRKLIKGIELVEIPTIDEEIQAGENEYQRQVRSISENRQLIAEINERNNKVLKAHSEKRNQLKDRLDDASSILTSGARKRANLDSQIEDINLLNFNGYTPRNTDDLDTRLAGLVIELENLEYYNDINDYANANALKNPVFAENIERIKRLRYATPDNLPEGEQLTDVCSCCGQSSQAVLDKGIENIISGIKAENRTLLTKEMYEANNQYLRVKSEIDRITDQIRAIDAENKKMKEREASDLRAFQIKKTNQLERLGKEITALDAQIKTAETDEKRFAKELEAHEKSVLLLEELPTDTIISEELKEMHRQFTQLNDDIIGAIAINKHNEAKRTESEKEIKAKQALLMQTDTDIVNLQNEISDYFSNLKGVVANEFSGKIEIGVELLEYVITRDEYKDVFKITANGKVFPYECNGALQNNTKLQILGTLQRLQGYSGITILDNAEANTTQPIKAGNLNLVVAKATDEKTLIIK